MAAHGRERRRWRDAPGFNARVAAVVLANERRIPRWAAWGTDGRAIGSIVAGPAGLLAAAAEKLFATATEKLFAAAAEKL